MIKSLTSIFFKDRKDRKIEDQKIKKIDRSRQSLKKIKKIKLLLSIFVFDVPPYLCQKIKLLPPILALQSFLKIDGIDSLSSIYRDRIDPIDLWKRSTLIESISSIFKNDWLWANRSFHDRRIFWSFDHIKRSIWSTNRWSNSQHCSIHILKQCFGSA